MLYGTNVQYRIIQIQTTKLVFSIYVRVHCHSHISRFDYQIRYINDSIICSLLPKRN